MFKCEDAQKLGCHGDSARMEDRTWESPSLLFASKGSTSSPPYRGCFAGVMIEFQNILDTEMLLLAHVKARFGQDSRFLSS